MNANEINQRVRVLSLERHDGTVIVQHAFDSLNGLHISYYPPALVMGPCTLKLDGEPIEEYGVGEEAFYRIPLVID